MIKAVFSLFVCVLLLAPVRAMAVDVQQVTSPGGITAWLVEEHAIPMVTVSFEFRGGAAADPDGGKGWPI